MANFFGEVYGQFGAVWKRLTGGQKVILVLVTTTILCGVAGVVYWSSRLEMGVLFGNVNPKDAGAIQSKLEDDGIPFELEDGGRTILVPRERVYELRNQLTQEGLVQGDGQGMEIFDTMQLGMTEFLQNVNLTRALEGELARTISWLNPVAAAKVHITRPKATIFTELQNPPTASVTLKLVPGRTLSQREVLGISNIVASAVEGLEPESVKIVDNKGRLLSRNSDDYEDEMGGGQLEVKNTFETAMAKKVQEQLDGVVGPNKVRVVINVDLDLQRETRQEKRFSYPEEGKVIRSEKVNTSDSSTSGPAGGGATGMESKLNETAGGGSGTSDRSTSEDSEREYAVNETNLDIVAGGATIERLSLAIMIDQSLNEQSTEIEQIVKQAVGFDESRGDTATTAIIEFSVPEMGDSEEALESYEQKEFILTLVKHVIQGLSVVGVILVLWLILRKADKRTAGQRMREARANALSTGQEETEAQVDRQRVREEVLSAVQSDTVMATDILHEWLKEE
ncbi:MAG: flagellar basal-body MS-ring/collar protein FliF [Planctomycetota bacterium]|jgi:flagellar M-ring protein FliF